MKKLISIISVITALSLLTACSRSRSGDIYVSLSESSSDMGLSSEADLSSENNSSTVPDKPLCNVSADFCYDGSSSHIMNSMNTVDSNYLYVLGYMYLDTASGDNHSMAVKLDLQSGEIEGMCSVPGCQHNQSECIHFRQMGSIRAFGKELRYVFGNRLMSFDGTKHTVLFTNNIVTQIGDPSAPISGEIAPDSMVDDICDLGGFVISENKTYLYGGNIVFVLDNDTFTVGNPIKAGDDIFYSICVYNDIVYAANSVNELYMVDIKTETVKKLGDKIVNPSVYNERLYYIKWDGSVPYLYSTSLDGTDEQVVLEDCYVNYVIKDDNVFYSQFSSDRALYMYSLDKKDKIKLSDIDMPDIVSADHIDRVFAIGFDDIQSWLSADGSVFSSIKYEKEKI